MNLCKAAYILFGFEGFIPFLMSPSRMLAELVALMASFLTALSSVMATRGMKDSNPDTANLLLTGIQTLVLTGILFLAGSVLWFPCGVTLSLMVVGTTFDPRREVAAGC